MAGRLSLLALLALTPAGSVDAQRTGASAARPPVPGGARITTVTIEQRMVIRVPRLPVGRTPLAANAQTRLPPIRWVEKRADRCVPAGDLAAAAIAGADRVDLVLNGGKRLRARFDVACPALDFYSGFYVRIPADGKICAARDSIRSRAGGECRIDSFRALVPAR
ncbi:hypothetical protein [Sphingomonas sp. RS2018]